jgi:hypothetical protein
VLERKQFCPLSGASAGRRAQTWVCLSLTLIPDLRLRATCPFVPQMDRQKINGFALLTKMILTTPMQETIKIPQAQLFTMKM